MVRLLPCPESFVHETSYADRIIHTRTLRKSVLRYPRENPYYSPIGMTRVGHLSSWKQQSPQLLPIEFIIVGGSICGLSCAIALSRAGHKVTVFDFIDPFVPVRLALRSLG